LQIHSRYLQWRLICDKLDIYTFEMAVLLKKYLYLIVKSNNKSKSNAPFIFIDFREAAKESTIGWDRSL
jgi:hypothetical protein